MLMMSGVPGISLVLKLHGTVYTSSYPSLQRISRLQVDNPVRFFGLYQIEGVFSDIEVRAFSNKRASSTTRGNVNSIQNSKINQRISELPCYSMVYTAKLGVDRLSYRPRLNPAFALSSTSILPSPSPRIAPVYSTLTLFDITPLDWTPHSRKLYLRQVYTPATLRVGILLPPIALGTCYLITAWQAAIDRLPDICDLSGHYIRCIQLAIDVTYGHAEWSRRRHRRRLIRPPTHCLRRQTTGTAIPPRAQLLGMRIALQHRKLVARVYRNDLPLPRHQLCRLTSLPP